MSNSCLANLQRKMNERRYTEFFQDDVMAAYYDQIVYAPYSSDSYLWELERARLLDIARRMAADLGRLKCLDFACGTGRVIAALEGVATQSVGVDTSSSMLDLARAKLTRSALRCGDILRQPTLVDSDYDLITAFRFFLNTEPEVRHAVLSALAGRLRDQRSRLIFNIHINTTSLLGVRTAVGRRFGFADDNLLSYWQVRRLVAQAGLRIEAWYGFGLTPGRLQRTRLGPAARRLDHWAVDQPALRWLTRDLVFVCRREITPRQEGPS